MCPSFAVFRTNDIQTVKDCQLYSSFQLTSEMLNKKDGYRQRNVRKFLHILASPGGSVAYW